jgi:hypothetical protein
MNKLKLNLAAHPFGDPPNANEPIISIDGVEIKHVTRLVIEMDAQCETPFGKVTLEFHPEIDGELLIEGDSFATRVVEYVSESEVSIAQRRDVLNDLRSHRDVWRGLLQEKLDAATDDADKSYYEHEINRFERAFNTLDYVFLNRELKEQG